MEVTCQYCHKNFSSNKNLKAHQQRAKYCIKLQVEFDKDCIVTYSKCPHCSKEFITKDKLKRHEAICKKRSENNQKLENLVAKLEDDLNAAKGKIKKLRSKNDILSCDLVQIKEENNELKIENAKTSAFLEKETEIREKIEELHTKENDCLHEIAKQPRTNNRVTTNNVVNNLPIFNLTVEQLLEAVDEKFTKELFLQGQKGAAKFAIAVAKETHNNQTPWKCTDASRGNFKLKNKDGIIIVDRKAKIITNLVADAIREKNKEYHNSFYLKNNSDEELNSDEEEKREAQLARADMCFQELSRMKRDNGKFVNILIEECD